MNSSIYFIIIVIVIIIYIFYRDKRMQNQLTTLLKHIGTLKFKMFQHESQLLEKRGVFVPDDSAEFVYQIIWNLLDQSQKDYVKNEYKKKCPSHVPMWKFVLYNYKIQTKLIEKESMFEYNSVNDLMNNNYKLGETFKEINEAVDDLKNMSNMVSKLKKEVNDLDKKQENDSETNDKEEKKRDNLKE